MEAFAADVLDSHFAKVKNHSQAPSLAYGVTVNGAAIARREHALPFRIASMTKSFTAAAVLLLRDRGRLQLDEPVGNYVPELRGLRGPTTDSPAITVRHLLTMTSGLATDDPWADRHLDASHAFMQQLLSSGGYFARATDAGFVYCNYGYAILGRVVSNVAGTSYRPFITSELLEPLEMTHTTWDVPPTFAPPFRIQDEAVVDEGLPPLQHGEFGAMGGLWSTVDDLLVWVSFLMDGFPARDGEDSGPLRRSSRREMQRISTFRGCEAVKLFDAERSLHGGYGMGLLAYDDELVGRIITHTGGLPGYGSNMYWCPDRKLAVVSLANITYAEMFRANVEAVELLRHNGHLPPSRSVPTEPLREHADALVNLLNTWTDRRADEIFSDNVALDESYERRRQAVAEFAGSITIHEVVGKNAAVAEVTASADGERLKISFSLSSQLPPRIQAYDLSVIAPDHS